ncbi:alpha SNAP [Schizosaccharomyces japonicus yFS275]|uniref:Alpha SNAP n=1 Tax=Schizosaccharomyces japonicus (strain yFS275 / FY16936) TaxID=402676 RepID=B6K833_SCHJY|nr:alpha SNAP [Schizosaccharomyces japonicus yFS275]EEB09687.1 alpha SNAP [Schizosaccharomyces japonicus yFS275]
MTADPEQLMKAAAKKAKGGSGFSAFFGGGNKYDEAGELYMDAANGFRLQKDLRSAGIAFEKAAEMQLKTDEKDDAANTLVEAYKAYRRDEPAEAIRVLSMAIELFTRRGNFRRAANYKMDIGTVLEQDLSDPKGALAAYEEAGEWFMNDQAEALANKAFLKTADLAALCDEYQTAINRYEQVAKASVNNNLLKWSVKEYLLKCGLCYMLMGDDVATRRAFDSFTALDLTFQSTREYQLLCDLQDAIEASDADIFAEKVFQFDQLSKLDSWKTTVLLKIKNRIQEAEDDLT